MIWIVRVAFLFYLRPAFCLFDFFCSLRGGEAGRDFPDGWSSGLSDTCSASNHQRQLKCSGLLFPLDARLCFPLVEVVHGYSASVYFQWPSCSRVFVWANSTIFHFPSTPPVSSVPPCSKRLFCHPASSLDPTADPPWSHSPEPSPKPRPTPLWAPLLHLLSRLPLPSTGAIQINSFNLLPVLVSSWVQL